MIPELHAAITAARGAGQIARSFAIENLDIAEKQNHTDLVTQADRQCEAHIKAVLQKAFPDYGFLGEESGGQEDSQQDSQQAGNRWVVDPIDGTLNFLSGFPYYCVNIALEKQGQLSLGVVYDVPSDQLYTAVKGGGAFCNGAPVRVNAQSKLKDAMLATGFMYRQDPDQSRWCMQRVEAVMQRARGVRRPGTAGLDLVHVGCGHFAAFWEPWLHPWDVAAGLLFVQEAGGTVSNDGGTPYQYSDTVVVASNGLIHQQLLEVLQEYPESNGPT